MSSTNRFSYKPVSVKENLVRMKDRAMLMVDLAFAAIIFKDSELANEVLDLEKEMNRLIHGLQISLMLIARDIKDASALQSLLQVALATENVSNAARDLVTPILSGIEPHPILLEGMNRLDEPIIAVKVSPASVLCKKHNDRKRLRAKLGVDLIAIRRQEKWLTEIENLGKILPEDILIARGEDTGISKLKELAVG